MSVDGYTYHDTRAEGEDLDLIVELQERIFNERDIASKARQVVARVVMSKLRLD